MHLIKVCDYPCSIMWVRLSSYSSEAMQCFGYAPFFCVLSCWFTHFSVFGIPLATFLKRCLYRSFAAHVLFAFSESPVWHPQPFFGHGLLDDPRNLPCRVQLRCEGGRCGTLGVWKSPRYPKITQNGKGMERFQRVIWCTSFGMAAHPTRTYCTGCTGKPRKTSKVSAVLSTLWIHDLNICNITDKT